ncbi:amino acid ABC transporter substrate-binding protein, PAAT family [Methylobacterium sp. ap11]|uniref:methanol oxidation system protein MoxJ n=1 Tax=Methylobacterium sp. ap11 TaxID=1761799 RepID=UPI0008AD34A2|nr:methanol oxidation system protein MoxJ [Methylobacterium sp. ap11]SEO57525.1 amino acid ABC transporter substrate-binding protein, PAAT family [Methylobacterium sp. ap11]
MLRSFGRSRLRLAGLTALAAALTAPAFAQTQPAPAPPAQIRQTGPGEAAAAAQSRPDEGVLRVCASAAQPPLSLKDGSGLENRIAGAVAEAMGREVQFVWSEKPAIYLVRDFLDKKLCDVVAGLDTGDPRVLTTKPYYRSGYVFVTRAQDGLDVTSWSDPRLKQVGHVAVPFGSPSEVMLKNIGRYEEDMAYLYSLVNFRSPRNQYTQIDPARLVGEVASGKADVAVPFGPDVARFVKASSVPLRMTLVADDAARGDGQKVAMRFDQSMGVRRDDEALLAALDQALVKARPAIEAILKDEGVPTVPTGS